MERAAGLQPLCGRACGFQVETDDDYFALLANQWDMYEGSAEYARWWSDSNRGCPASARPPSESVTPPSKMSELALKVSASPTPVKVPLPMAKRQLKAAIRVQKELMSGGKQAKESKESKECPKKEAPKPSETSAGCSAKSKVEVKKVAEKKKAARRSHKHGPMQDAMKAFFEKCASKGLSYAEARAKWTSSKERSAIIKNMSEAERRRRRFK